MLSDAMADLVADIRNGAALETAAAAIAPDYGFHPSLLVRKFHEAYPLGLPRLAAPEELADMENRIIQREVEERVGLRLAMEHFVDDPDMRKLLRKVCGL